MDEVTGHHSILDRAYHGVWVSNEMLFFRCRNILLFASYKCVVVAPPQKTHTVDVEEFQLYYYSLKPRPSCIESPFFVLACKQIPRLCRSYWGSEQCSVMLEHSLGQRTSTWSLFDRNITKEAKSLTMPLYSTHGSALWQSISTQCIVLLCWGTYLDAVQDGIVQSLYHRIYIYPSRWFLQHHHIRISN